MFHPYKKGSGGQQSLLSGKSGQTGKTKKSEGPAANSGLGSDYNLVAPIRQTASIFKQPVTVYKEHKSKVGTNTNKTLKIERNGGWVVLMLLVVLIYPKDLNFISSRRQ